MTPEELATEKRRRDAMAGNSDFVRALYAAFGRGDLKVILENCAPDIEWASNGTAGDIPWGGARKGVTGVESFFHLLAEYLDFEAFEPGEFFEAGEAVIVRGFTRARVKRRGVFESGWVHIFTLQNGKLARFEEYYDTAAIKAALAG
jgi:uncharacterized protein